MCVCVWLIHKCISRNIDGSTCGTDAGKVWGGGLASICYESHVLHKSKARRREGEGCSDCRRIRLQFVLISIKFAVLICALLPCTRSCYVYASLRFDWLPVGSAIDWLSNCLSCLHAHARPRPLLHSTPLSGAMLLNFLFRLAEGDHIIHPPTRLTVLHCAGIIY